MNSSPDTEFRALTDAILRDDRTAFVDLVNHGVDLFGHDDEGHSLLWYAYQSAEPFYVETLLLMADGRRFGDEEEIDNQSEPQQEELSDGECIIFGKRLSIAQFWLSAFVVFFVLLVTAYPFAVLCYGRSLSFIGTLWLPCFCVFNARIGYIALRNLNHPDNKHHELECGFFSLLCITLAVSLGFCAAGLEGKEQALLCMATIPVFWLINLANYWRNRRFKDDASDASGNSHDVEDEILYVMTNPVTIPFLSGAATIVMLESGNGSWTSRSWMERDPGVVVVVCAVICLGIALMPSADDSSEGGQWRKRLGRAASRVCWGGCFIAFLLAVVTIYIPRMWYGTVYSVAEWATYHNHPSIVLRCLPEPTENLSFAQKKSLGGSWVESAFEYAVQQGDLAGARVYERYRSEQDVQYMWQKLATKMDMRPLTDELKRVKVHFNDREAIQKQLSYDAPELLPYIIADVPQQQKWRSTLDFIDRIPEDKRGVEPSFRLLKAEEEAIELMMTLNARKCAAALLQRDGGHAGYGVNQRTLLEVAVENSAAEMVETLLLNGADPDYAQLPYETPRRMAERANWEAALKLFNRFSKHSEKP